MFKILSFGLSFLIIRDSYAQQLYDDSVVVAQSADYAKNIYNLQREDDLPIYNGIQHFPYSSAIDGIAYFQSDSWQKGTVIYENVFYNDILMKYDLVTDKLIVSNPKGGIFISLFSPRIKEFGFSGFKFIRLEKSEKIPVSTGFYQVLAEGKATLLVKTIRTISEQIVDNAIYRKFEQTIRYYILKDGIYHPVSNKNGLLNVLKEKRKAVQDFISQKSRNYRKNTENTILAAVKFYNQ
jgi:hypothetical protein